MVGTDIRAVNMGCHPKARARITAAILRDPKNIDLYLDLLYDAMCRATEWDAEKWGFDPDRWMAEQRVLMERRIKDEAARNNVPRQRSIWG